MARDKDDPWHGSNRKAEEGYSHPDPDRHSGDLDDEDDTQGTEKESKSKSDDA